ncbi:MAG: permease [Candidatus Omnitrophota bacterium]
MNWKSESKKLSLIAAVFLGCYYLPVNNSRFLNALLESLHLVKWYAREHVLLCLVPAFFIAGAISVFVRQNAVMKYLGPKAPKVLAYGVASISGTILAVCSCTVLPLFAGIYRMGAGLGPATAFLYSGPAINVLAIVLTAAVLGFDMGLARAVGAIVFSVVVGLAMHFIFRKEEIAKANAAADLPETDPSRPLWQNAFYFAALAAILVFANWAKPESSAGIWFWIYSVKWPLTGLFSVCLAVMLVFWFRVKWWNVLFASAPAAMLAFLLPHIPAASFAAGFLGLSILIASRHDELGDWFASSWGFAKQILPLLFLGVLAAGFLLGRPGQEGIIPSKWVSSAVGGNSLFSNLFASVFGAFMYFATLTEIPILQGLIGSGMGQGPALALLLAGPALSLPSMLVIRSVIGTKKTIFYVSLVVVMATVSGLFWGWIIH